MRRPPICRLTCITGPELLGRFGNDGVGVVWGEPGHEVCVHIPVVREPAAGQWEGRREGERGGGKGEKEGGKECQLRCPLLIASTPVSPISTIPAPCQDPGGRTPRPLPYVPHLPQGQGQHRKGEVRRQLPPQFPRLTRKGQTPCTSLVAGPPTGWPHSPQGHHRSPQQ